MSVINEVVAIDGLKLFLRKRAKFIDTYGGVHKKPVPNSDLIIILYDEDLMRESFQEWLFS